MEQAPGEWQDKTSTNLPANYVSWLDVVSFCNFLSRREGLEACYKIDGDHVEWNRKANGYRLPTEAEWEYVGRVGPATHWSFGDDEAMLERYAWYSKNAEGKVHEVMGRLPNGFGLYDMHGNVWEWVWDWFGEYQSETQIDPVGPESGQFRCLHGGSAWDGSGGLRSARRYRGGPGGRGGDIGFRCVRAPAAANIDTSNH